MFCSRCGATLPEGSAFCTNCGTPVPQHPGSPPGAPIAAPLPQGAYAAQPMFLAPPLPYAGFWLRFAAYLIDGVIMGICFIPVIAILALATGAGAALSHIQNSPPEDFVFPAAVIMFVLLLIVAIIGGAWLYYALMESSTWQATLGKRAIGLMVTDIEGKRLTFGHATGRYFAKMITGMVPLAIGYIMAGFTQKKQALHDFIAATLVLKRM